MSSLDGEIQIPKLGGVKKKTLLLVGGAAAAFVGWRYYQASADGYEGETVEGDEYADGGTIPSVSGAYQDDNSYGIGDSDTPSTDSYGFTGTTNAQWTQYVATQLVASDVWSYTDILAALGNYLNGQALTSIQKQIVQAAIAVANYPPVGNHPIISGGDTDITVAPPNVKVASTTDTTASLTWGAVPGAAEYWVFHTGTNATVTAGGTSRTVTGLKPNTSYSFQVAARSSAGKLGPKSTSVTGKTKALALKAPTGVRVTGVVKTSAKVSWSKVSGATGYNIFVNGKQNGESDGTSYIIRGLKPNTSYSVSVRADTATQAPGPSSVTVRFKTKK